MRDPIILLVHLIATLARLMGPGGLRSVVAESLLVKHQLLILNRSRHRAPNLRVSDRILAGVCALFMRPARVFRSAIVLRPSTILNFHRTLRQRKYRLLYSPKRRRTGPKSCALGFSWTLDCERVLAGGVSRWGNQIKNRRRRRKPEGRPETPPGAAVGDGCQPGASARRCCVCCAERISSPCRGSWGSRRRGPRRVG